MAKTNENAVSPVVGVMLMLVVTIIIAAVVSAFAGGMGASQTKVPQASLKAEYSIADGMTIYHTGGDTLTVGDFRILLTKSRNTGSIEEQSFVNEINQSLIWSGKTVPFSPYPPPGTPAHPEMWYDDKGARAVSRFAAGDVAYITASNCNTDKLTPNLIYYGSNNGINQSVNVGGTFFLDFVTKDGKKISRIEVPIKP